MSGNKYGYVGDEYLDDDIDIEDDEDEDEEEREIDDILEDL